MSGYQQKDREDYLARGQKPPKRRRKRKALNLTRCPSCFIRLRFTDDQDGDEFIADHLAYDCEVENPAPLVRSTEEAA